MTLQNDFHAMVEYASKAPSGHNTQPWFFTLGADAITITPDFSKRLPVVDPDDRELFISLGCAAENLRIAASHYGYATTTAVSGQAQLPSASTNSPARSWIRCSRRFRCGRPTARVTTAAPFRRPCWTA